MKFKQIIREHWIAIVLALLTSVIVASPQVAFRIEHRSDGVYQGIELLPDNSWPPRVREIMDGHGFGSIYYKDGKNDPYLFQPFGSMTVAYIGKTFSLDINNTLLLSRLVLSSVAFLLIYCFVFLLSRDRLAALASASALLLADAAMNLSGLTNLLNGISPSNFLNISQPVNPAMIFIPFFGFLVSFWFFYTKRDWRLGVLSAFLLGLNFYNYFYSWTYLYAFGGFLVLLFLLQRNRREALRISGVFLGALVVAIPYGINLYHAAQYSTFADVGMRQGIIFTHSPAFVGVIVIASVVVFLFWFPREDNKKYLFWLALLLTPFVTLNQQIFTGKEMQPAHYHWYFHKTIAFLLVVTITFYLFGRLKTGWYRRVFAVLVIVASFAVGIFIQANSFTSDRGDAGIVAVERQKYGPVMDWLNQNAVKEEMVLSNDSISYLVTIYTPLNVFYHRGAPFMLSATKERLLETTIFTFYRLRGVGDKEIRDVVSKDLGYISRNIFGIYYRQLSGSYEAIPDEEIQNIITLYEATLATPAAEWLKQVMVKYEVSYVVWDKKADPDWQVEKYPFFKKVATFGDIAVYEFNLK